MANDRSPAMHEDLGPSATRALAAAYDFVLESRRPEAPETYPLLRYLLARHLVGAAFAGERDPGLLRERAIAYVAKWFETRTPTDDFGRCGICGQRR
jgi:hypothetical protein